jgi:hypothetical protein
VSQQPLFDVEPEPVHLSRVHQPFDVPAYIAPAQYGFSPERVTAAKTLVRDVAAVLLADRPDRAFLLPVLVTSLNTTLGDFMLGHAADASEGFASPDARHEYMARRIAAMQAWDAQPQDGAR